MGANSNQEKLTEQQDQTQIDQYKIAPLQQNPTISNDSPKNKDEAANNNQEKLTEQQDQTQIDQNEIPELKQDLPKPQTKHDEALKNQKNESDKPTQLNLNGTYKHSSGWAYTLTQNGNNVYQKD